MASRQTGNRERGTEKKGDISYCQSVIEDINRCIVWVTTVFLRYFGILSIAINLFINLKKNRTCNSIEVGTNKRYVTKFQLTAKPYLYFLFPIPYSLFP